MSKIRNFVVFASVFFLFLVQGCAKKPVEELANAEEAIKKAIEAEAPMESSELFSKADSKLSEGKKLIAKKKYKKAKPILEECIALASKAIEDAKAKKAAKAIEEAAKAEKVPGTKKVKKRDVDTHTVKVGDCLWYISESYYKDPYLWSDIYSANKDKISNPDLIYPDQVLVLPLP